MKRGVRHREPFSLGLPGEYWNDTLKCIVVPVGADVVLVSCSSDYRTYTVVTKDKDTDTDSALMAAALVYEVINGYHKR